MYEVLFVRFGLSVQNPILKPIQDSKNYFYNKGISLLPKNNAEKAYWYYLLQFYPIGLESSSKERGSFGKNYGVKFTKDILNNIFINMDILNRNDMTYDNKYIKDKLVWSYFNAYEEMVHNFHISPNARFLELEAMVKVRDKRVGERMLLVYKMAKAFYSNPKYKNEVKNELLSNHRMKKEHYKALFDNIMIVMASRMHNEIFLCTNIDDQLLIKDMKLYKNKLQEMIYENKLKEADIKHLKYLINIKLIKLIEKISGKCEEGLGNE